MFRHRFLFVTGLLLFCGATTLLAAPPFVSLELVTEPGIPIGGHQRWISYLKDLGFSSIRIRGARAGDEPKLEQRGSRDAPRYGVTGILTDDNVLHLPGISVRRGQRKELVAWLEQLQGGGEEAISAQKGAFGLTVNQVVALHEALKTKVASPTKGKPARDVVQQIAGSLRVNVELDAAARGALSGDVLDELQGLGGGTALAAVVRPFGLIVVPTGQGQRDVGLLVTRAGKSKETWPVGTRPKTPPDKLVPALFKFINVEIHDRPLSEALGAIQGRLEIPFLFDHNALARDEIDLDAKVNFAPRNTFYKKILDELLFQSLLRSELRVDESDQPFLWITTIKN